MKLKIPLLLMIGLLTACGSETGLQETNYEEFRDTLNTEEYTGFAYLLDSYNENEEEIDLVVEDIFNNNNESVVFLNTFDLEEDINEQYKNEYSSVDLYFPRNKVAYLDDGEVVDEIEIDTDLHESEHNNKLGAFIQNYQ